MQGISKYSAENIATIEKVITRRFGISRGELRTLGRFASTPRFIMFYILHKHFMYSSNAIGRMYNKDHSSVLNGIKKVRGNKAISDQADDIFTECLGTMDNFGDKDVYSDRYNVGIAVDKNDIFQKLESCSTAIPTTIHITIPKKRRGKSSK